MTDQEIRQILIAYLEAAHTEIRIYEEKSIGSAICDVMAVTDCLTGYEIKSGHDNYHRLDSQVEAYRSFFDLNYIVVGTEHRRTVADRVPAAWGIMVVEPAGVNVVRKARLDKNGPSRRSQLMILWKLELKNLLTRANLPAYTYKSKSYIIDQLLHHLDDADIGKYVACELLHRDTLRFDAADFAEDPQLPIHKNLPTNEIVESLSEQDFDEITLDQWISLYQKAKELHQSKESIYKAEKPTRTRHEIPYTDIEAAPGVPWISKAIIGDFVVYLSTGKEAWEVEKAPPFRGAIHWEPVTGNWHIGLKNDWTNRFPQRLKHEYGLPGCNALYILEGMMNLRSVKRETEAETLAVLEKQEAIRTLFQTWLWQDEDRRWAVEESYNQQFQKLPSKQYDGSKLQFPEMNSEVNLYPYQMDAVQRILSEKNTLLAFDVGAGKTLIMIAAAMKLRQQGRSRRNLFVVPNHIVGQWELMFKKLYPTAKVLAIEPRSFKSEMRQKVLRQIQQGDYDGVIMAYSCFEMIPLAQQQIIRRMKRSVAEIDQALNRAAYTGSIVSTLRKEKKYIAQQAKELSEAFSTAVFGICFEDLEISTLFVDEAHNFKNIPIQTNLKNVNGINKAGSLKCLSMLHKVRCIQESSVGRGVVFATGTPLCNSITDAYAMQMYLQYDMLKALHLDRFDNWVKTFAQPQRVCEIDVDIAKFRFVNRFVRFFNLPELSRMFSAFSIFHAMDEGELPEMNGYDDTLIDRSPQLQSYMVQLCQRTEKIRSRDVHPSKDNMLKVSTDGRKAALDLRLVDREQPFDESSKLYHCVRNVMRLYRDEPGCSQIIFCDYSTPKHDAFSVYDALRSSFLSSGVPAKEIAFVHSYHTEERKAALYRQMNEGKVRILIGSTFKLGIGANVQTRLKAIHHLDVPWRPADMVQREGRILRKGNTYANVRIFRYITNGSFDAYCWQILETKQKFISQFLSGSAYQRSVSDLEENVLTYAQVKALAISEPLMKKLAEKQNEVRRLQLLQENETALRKQAKTNICVLEQEAQTLLLRSYRTSQNAKHLAVNADYPSAYVQMKTAFEHQILSKGDTIVLLGFSVSLLVSEKTAKPELCLERLGEKYIVPLGESAAGNARRVINTLRKMQNLSEECQMQYNEWQKKIAAEREALLHPDLYAEQIHKAQKEADVLMQRVKCNHLRGVDSHGEDVYLSETRLGS